MDDRIVRHSMRALAFVTVCIALVGIVPLAHGQNAQSPTSSDTNLVSAHTSDARQPGQVDQSQSVVRSSPSVEAAVHHDASPPLLSLPPAPRQSGQQVHPVRPIPRPINGGGADPAVSGSVPTLQAPAPALNFDGIGNGFSGPAGTFSVTAAPPDTEGDVGPNHYVQIVNTDFAIFNKSGIAVYGPVPINTLWSGFGGGCQTNNDGDPVVIYDPIADRWIISQFSVSTTPYLQCVAVSQTPDPTGAYYRYSFHYTDFPDYPKMGVWPDAYYITFNMFAGGTIFSGGTVCAYDRASMMAGAAATQQCFSVGTNYGGLLPADLDGARQPPAGSPNYVLALGAAVNQLAFWKFQVDWAMPANTTLTGPTTLTTAAFSEGCGGGTCIPQAGTTQQLDSLADRLMFRLAYRNFGDHEALVANHSVTAGSSVGVRWYEIRSPGTTPTIFQQGTYAPDSNFRWMGSIAMDQSGNMALGFSLSGSKIHPEIHYTGRLAGDPAGQMTQGEGVFIDGAGSQTGSNLSRWGDHSMMAVDPTDDCTFWYTNEYFPSDGAFNWKTRIGSFKFPGCAPPANDFSVSASPTSLSLLQGTSGMSTVSTAVMAGNAETVNLTVSGVPSRAIASLSPTSVTAGGSSTLTVKAGNPAAGTYTLTVTGTAASATHITTVTLTVSAATATHFAVSAPGTATAGTAFNLTVTAKDAFDHTVTGYGGTVHFTSTDPQAVLPANTALTSGTGTFSATPKTAGNQRVAATDTANATINGSSTNIVVRAGSPAMSSCIQNLAIGNFTLCGESYNDVSKGTNVQVNYGPSPSNGIIAWATWCFNSSCKSSISGVTATIGDNINATESCFVASPHSPFITNANGGAEGSGDFQQHYVWYCPSIPSGVTSFTVTPSNPNLSYLQLNISEWKAGSLAASCSPISACFEDVDNFGQAGNSTGGTTATITTSGATVNANDLVFAVTEVPCCSFTASPGTEYSGITVAPSVTPGMVSEAKAATATGIQTATTTWTGGTTPWFGVIVPLKSIGAALVVATPTFSPGAGKYSSAQSVTIKSATSGATICYTTNGIPPAANTPGTCSTGTKLANGGRVRVGVSETLQAIGTKSGLTNSPVARAAYVITVATPTFSPGAGKYSSAQSVTIKSATSWLTDLPAPY
jgi:Chitobiase/beta-hexosaminidase C-terminal domain